jgi:predicted Ser/Thr protein kinase
MDTASSAHCPRCGASLDEGSVDGLCAKCLGALNFTTDTVLPGEAATTVPSPTPEEISTHFPQLEVMEFLGRGGMGVVHKARQKALGRLVALKLLAPERVADPKFAERFTHEAKALAALNHPNIVTIYDFGQAGGFYYLLMEFVDGVNLRQAMAAGRFTPEQALAIVPPVCEALQYAHEHGIVHRDIKPENLLLDKEGRVKIADFGIAKILGAESSGVGLTETQPAGTPQYMAPEQKEHRVTDHRADIYSLGVVLYEMLTGELPTDKLQPPSKRVQVDVRIDEIVLRALEVKPELRFQTAADFRTRVENAKSGKAVALTAGPTSVPGIPFRLVEERDGRRVIVWRGVLAAGIAVFAIALVVGAALSLVVNGGIPSRVVVALAGIIAFLVVGSSVRISLKPGTAPHSESDDTTGPPRFSRAAIVGACWVPVTVLSFVAAALASHQGWGGPTAGPEWWQLAVLVPALILGVAGPFGTTILGWVAVSQIRRSAGRIHGLHLALFDGLIFPLMTLSAAIAMAGVALAKMFVDFYANPLVIGQPHIAPVTRMANWLSLNKEVGVFVGVVAAIVVNVLIVRAVMRAVRREVVSAPQESSATGHEIQTSSIAVIFALISTVLGALAALRSAGAWPAMALSLLFAGLAIFMALPVRRLGVGKCALIIAALGMGIWPLIAFVVRQGRTAVDVNASGIERVEITEDRAVVRQRRFDGEGMIVTFGPMTNRWTPVGVYLDAMLDVTLEPAWLGRGASWVVKSRRGTYARYRLDGPPGSMLGKIVFHPGTPAPDTDGSFVIGEFQSDGGEPLPIAVRLDSDKQANSFPAGEREALSAPIRQTPSFHWPNEFLVVVVALFVLAMGAPWMRVVRRLPLGRFLPAASATSIWFAYEFYLRSISPPGDPLIRVDLFLLIPLAIVTWLTGVVAFALCRRG